MAKSEDILVRVKADVSTANRDFQTLFTEAIDGSEKAKDQINKILGGTKETVVELKLNARTGELEKTTKVLRSEWDKIDKQRKQILKTEEGSLTNLKQTLSNLVQARNAIAKYKDGVDASGRSIRVITNKWSEANAKVDEASRKLREASRITFAGVTLPSFDGLLKGIGKFNAIGAAVATVIQLIGQINQSIQIFVQRATQVSQIQLAFKTFGLSVDDAAQALNDAKAISLSFGVSLESVEKAYKRLTPTITANGGTISDVSGTIQALSARMTALGLNTDQSNRYIEAFAQVMGKGKLQGEELNQQFAEIDGALRAQIANYAAAKYGITDFEGAMSSGAITAELFREAFIAISQEAIKELEGSIGDLQSRLDDLNPAQIENIKGTINTISIDQLNEAFSETGQLFQSIGLYISQFFADLLIKSDGFKEALALIGNLLGGAIYGAVLIIAQAIKIFVTTIEIIVFLLKGAARILVFLAAKFGEIIGLGEIFAQAPWVKPFIEGKTTINDLFNATRNWFADNFGKFPALQQYVKEYNNENKKVVQTLDQQIAATQRALDARKAELNEAKILWGIEKANLEERIEKLKGEKDVRIQGLEDAKSAEDTYHSGRMAQLNEQLEALKKQKDEIKDRYAAEIAALEAKTPAEERLLQLRKQELLAKANNAKLTEKERLEAQASYDQLVRSEKIAEIRLKQKQEEEALEKKIADKQKEKTEEENRHKAAIEDLNKKLDQTKKNYDEQIKALNEQIKQKDNQFQKADAVLKLEQSRLEAAKQSAKATGDLNKALDDTQPKIGNVANAAERIESALRKASTYKLQIPNIGKNEFAGGPVTGGTTYTVNELGQEAFLSASGRLSMINAPAWGQWKAPATGTIIPAHLAAQLDIPKGGINLNAIRTPKAGVSMGSISSTYSRSKTVGDNIINNVTIQSDNPTQAASDILVNLVRQRRMRRQ